MLAGEDLGPRGARALLGALLGEVQRLAPASLPVCVQTILDAFVRFCRCRTEEAAQGQGAEGDTAAMPPAIELLPALVHCCGSLSTVDPDSRCREDVQTMDSAEYQAFVVRSLLRTRWPSDKTASVLALFKDLPASSPDLRTLLLKSLRCAASLPPSALPSLTYQVLLLSSRGHRELALRGVVRLAERLRQATSRPEPSPCARPRPARPRLRHVRR